jgi:hypothetical protein
MSTERYVDFDPRQGYPRADNLFYECQQCGKLVPSVPERNIWCDCYNIAIDVDAGRLGVRVASLVKLICKYE